MQKKRSVIGNSLGLVIDEPVLALLRIDRDTVLDVSSDGDALIIRPLRDAKDERVRAAASRVAEQHASAFEKLAK
jgi:antitoxin MazE